MFKKLKEKYPRLPFDLILATACVFLLLGALSIYQNAFGETVVDVGFGAEFDDQHTFGRNPVGIVRLRQKLFDGVYVGYEHHSSVADENDRNVYDGIEVILQTVFFGEKGGCIK